MAEIIEPQTDRHRHTDRHTDRTDYSIVDPEGGGNYNDHSIRVYVLFLCWPKALKNCNRVITGYRYRLVMACMARYAQIENGEISHIYKQLNDSTFLRTSLVGIIKSNWFLTASIIFHVTLILSFSI